MRVEDGYERIIGMVFAELLNRGTEPEILSQCITDAITAESEDQESRMTMLSAGNRASRLLEMAYTVHCESIAEHWEETINRLCGDEPPYSYTDHVGDA